MTETKRTFRDSNNHGGDNERTEGDERTDTGWNQEKVAQHGLLEMALFGVNQKTVGPHRLLDLVLVINDIETSRMTRALTTMQEPRAQSTTT